MLSPKQART